MTVRVALAQVGWMGDSETTLDAVEAAVIEAASRGAGLVAFPELCTTPYFCRHKAPAASEYAERIPGGRAIQRLASLARETSVVLVVPLAERAADRLYNTAAIIDADGRLVGRYRKQHLPHGPGAWERSHFHPGDGWPVFNTAVGDLGVAICWDRYFPETWRALTLAGAQIIVNPIASSIDRTDPLATLVQPAEAFLNQVFIATVNRVGRDHEGEPTYSGGSYVATPTGEILGALASAGPEVVIRDLPLDLIERDRASRPLLSDRRPQTYGSLTEPHPRARAVTPSDTRGSAPLGPEAESSSGWQP